MFLDSPDRIKQTLARYMNLGVHIKKNERLNHILLNTNKTNETGRIVLRRGGVTKFDMQTNLMILT